MDISLEVTQDMDLVKSIITIGELWDKACDFDLKAEDYYPTANHLNAWLLPMIDTEIIGIYLAHVYNSATLQVHPYILSKYNKFCRDSMRAFFGWFLGLTPGMVKLIAAIPACYMSTYNFAKKMGFQDEGINRLSYRRDDKIFDIYNMGITREEIAEYLK